MPTLRSRLVSTSAAVLAATCVLAGTTAAAAAAGANSNSAFAQAKKHLLTLADMPRGWTVEKGSTYSKGSSNNIPGASTLAACIGVPSSLIIANPPEEDSPYYQNKSGSLEVQDSVTVFPSTKNAKAELAAMTNTRTPTCFAQAINSPAGKAQIESGSNAGSKLGTVTVTALHHLPSHISGFAMTLPITSQGQSATVHDTMVFYVKGRLGHQISFTSYGGSFPSSLIDHISADAKGTL